MAETPTTIQEWTLPDGTILRTAAAHQVALENLLRDTVAGLSNGATPTGKSLDTKAMDSVLMALQVLAQRIEPIAALGGQLDRLEAEVRKPAVAPPGGTSTAAIAHLNTRLDALMVTLRGISDKLTPESPAEVDVTRGHLLRLHEAARKRDETVIERLTAIGTSQRELIAVLGKLDGAMNGMATRMAAVERATLAATGRMTPVAPQPAADLAPPPAAGPVALDPPPPTTPASAPVPTESNGTVAAVAEAPEAPATPEVAAAAPSSAYWGRAPSGGRRWAADVAQAERAEMLEEYLGGVGSLEEISSAHNLSLGVGQKIIWGEANSQGKAMLYNEQTIKNIVARDAKRRGVTLTIGATPEAPAPETPVEAPETPVEPPEAPEAPSEPPPHVHEPYVKPSVNQAMRTRYLSARGVSYRLLAEEFGFPMGSIQAMLRKGADSREITALKRRARENREMLLLPTHEHEAAMPTA